MFFECVGLDYSDSFEVVINFIVKGKGHVLFQFDNTSSIVKFSSLYQHFLHHDGITAKMWQQFVKNMSLYKYMHDGFSNMLAAQTDTHVMNITIQLSQLITRLSIDANLPKETLNYLMNNIFGKSVILAVNKTNYIRKYNDMKQTVEIMRRQLQKFSEDNELLSANCQATEHALQEQTASR